MDDLSGFCCLNSDCPDHGRRDAGNLTVTGRYGPHRERRMLRCRTCKARFSERKGTVRFGSRLDSEEVESVLEHIAEGCGVRQTERLCKVNRKTVARYSRRAGDHVQKVHDAFVAVFPSDPRGPVRREMGLRGQEGEALRPSQPGDDHRGEYFDHLEPERLRRSLVKRLERLGYQVTLTAQDEAA